MSSKNPEKSLQRSQFESQLFWHEHGEGNARQAAQASHEDEEDAFFFLVLNSATPIQLRSKELCGGF